MHASPALSPHRPERKGIKRLCRAVTATASAAATLTAVACASTPAAGSAPVEKPDLTVAVVPATGAAGVYIAAQDGYFTAAGLHVKIVPVTSGADALADLANGSVDAVEGQWTSDLAAEAGHVMSLHALAPGISGGQGLEQVMIPPHSTITTVQQLRGATIAVNALQGLPVLLIDTVLAAAGLSPAQVHFTAIPFPSMGAALAAGRVSAAFMVEPYITQAGARYGVQPLLDLDQGATANFPVTGYVVTSSWMSRYPRTAAAFSRALARGQTLAATSRAAVERALMRFTTISAQTAAVMALGSFPLDVTVSDLQRVGDLMQQRHALGASVNVTQLAQEMTR